MADFEKEEFKFPHEAEEAKGKPLEAKEDDVEIIIEDDTPLEDRDQKPMPKEIVKKLEVADEYILPILFSLNINKNKSYNPVALKKRIETALELITISDAKPMNLIMIGQLNLLDKLADICIDYEVDVKCTIEVRA
jgi:hypothetical protein